MSLVKVCGITRPEDARGCEELGVWALGFIQVAESPRYCPPERARDLIRQLDGRALTVGVFQDTKLDSVNAVSRLCGFDLVQLHGDETPQECRRAELPVIKAFSVDEGWNSAAVEEYEGSVAFLLFDTRREGRKGGTGQPFVWDLVFPLDRFSHPVIMAGGLGEDTIPALLAHVTPYALDCNSRVETAPGRKDLRAVRRVMSLADGNEKDQSPVGPSIRIP